MTAIIAAVLDIWRHRYEYAGDVLAAWLQGRLG